ncbi:hypothetical protein C9374_004259 [Naegleria lovaniensis]|uniref:Uncharacterized protein n=1 Tax=Naegleria lovaniensis TaxID=51637 RepID=A0AA88GSC5_NAELO|nr:uncharacterized protein C9374_004259 [Naegleria lovaniensis]KAG2383588.1 hypothetical protein C9374_004259 [Naegleria lovaniensis]
MSQLIDTHDTKHRLNHDSNGDDTILLLNNFNPMNTTTMTKTTEHASSFDSQHQTHSQPSLNSTISNLKQHECITVEATRTTDENSQQCQSKRTSNVQSIQDSTEVGTNTDSSTSSNITIQQFRSKRNSNVKKKKKKQNSENTNFSNSSLDMLNNNIIDDNTHHSHTANMTSSTDITLKSMNTHESSLPIHAFQSRIIKCIEKNQIVIITGFTGCGKSTQLPQMIMKHEIEHQLLKKKDQQLNQFRTRHPKIICTQPRRIAATGLARRVHTELNKYIQSILSREYDKKKDVPDNDLLKNDLVKNNLIHSTRVGFMIGGDAQYDPNTSILFATEGCLTNVLMKGYQDENFFKNFHKSHFTHIILDEIHERNVDTDLLLYFVRELSRVNAHVKIILMSATLAREQLCEYFSKSMVPIIPKRSGSVTVAAGGGYSQPSTVSSSTVLPYTSASSSSSTVLPYTSSSSIHAITQHDILQQKNTCNTNSNNNSNTNSNNNHRLIPPCIHIPTGCHPVEEYYLHDILKMIYCQGNLQVDEHTLIQKVGHKYHDITANMVLNRYTSNGNTTSTHQPLTISPLRRKLALQLVQKLHQIHKFNEQQQQPLMERNHTSHHSIQENDMSSHHSSHDTCRQPFTSHHHVQSNHESISTEITSSSNSNGNGSTTTTTSRTIEATTTTNNGRDVSCSSNHDHSNNNHDHSSILIFLPGMTEIEDFLEDLTLAYVGGLDSPQCPFEIHILHSLIAREEQELALLPVSNKNKRKIILSTNIAESSITVPDISIVIDFCMCKELIHDYYGSSGGGGGGMNSVGSTMNNSSSMNSSGMNSSSMNSNNFNNALENSTPMLSVNWISKNSAIQRKGRAGRVKPGWCYRMVTLEEYECFRESAIPEIQRKPLPEVLLRILMMSGLYEASRAFQTAFQSEENVEHPSESTTTFSTTTTTSSTTTTTNTSCHKLNKHEELSNLRRHLLSKPPSSVLNECLDPPSIHLLEASYQQLLACGAIERIHPSLVDDDNDNTKIQHDDKSICLDDDQNIAQNDDGHIEDDTDIMKNNQLVSYESISTLSWGNEQDSQDNSFHQNDTTADSTNSISNMNNNNEKTLEKTISHKEETLKKKQSKFSEHFYATKKGRFFSLMPLQISHSQLILLGYSLNILPYCIIASAIISRSLPFLHFSNLKLVTARSMYSFDQNSESDIIASIRAYLYYKKLRVELNKKIMLSKKNEKQTSSSNSSNGSINGSINGSNNGSNNSNSNRTHSSIQYYKNEFFENLRKEMISYKLVKEIDELVMQICKILQKYYQVDIELLTPFENTTIIIR